MQQQDGEELTTMRNYGKIAPAFWIRGSGKKLRGFPQAQVLALYLMSCPASNMVGVFYLPFVTMAHETGLTELEAAGALTLLSSSDIDIAHYDRSAELVWVPNLAEHQVGPDLKPGDKRRFAILDVLGSLGKHPFVDAFLARYHVPYMLGTALRQASASEGASEGASRPPSMPVSVSVSETVTVSGAVETSSDAGASSPTEPEVRQKSGAKKKAGRAARTHIPLDWQPSPEQEAFARSHRLDVPGIVEDFRNYWRNEGKLGADWNAAFRNNINKILRTQWMLQRWQLPENVTPSARAPGAAPPTHGPPAPAPEGMVERMRQFVEAQRPPLAVEPETRKASS